MEKVFVYGSLMRGMRLHGYLEKSRFLGEGHVEGKLFPNPYIKGNPPVIIEIEDSPSNEVYGELYEISKKTLNTLDKVEGHPYLYQRVEATVYTGGFLESLDAWVYVFPVDPIPSGSWREYMETL
jgi:gamma-glutamylaminecyclotransferase